LFLVRTLARTTRLNEASAIYAQLVAAQPEPLNWENALLEWTQLLARTKQHAKAQAELEKAFARAPQRGRLAAALAYLLAANPQLNLCDGARALELAQRVYQATKTVQPGALVTLALAELGRCQEAAALQQRLIATTENTKQTALAAKFKTDLMHYEKAAPACRPGSEVSGTIP
jgi:tetratricopeptide (TPR) repeat protein